MGSLPEINSLGATLPSDVDTFHIAKLFNRTTKFVVISFLNWESKRFLTSSFWGLEVSLDCGRLWFGTPCKQKRKCQADKNQSGVCVAYGSWQWNVWLGTGCIEREGSVCCFDKRRLKGSQTIFKPNWVNTAWCVANPRRPVAGSRRQVVRIAVHLQLRQRHLECSPFAEFGVTRTPFSTRIITQMQVDSVRVKMVRGLYDVVACENLGWHTWLMWFFRALGLLLRIQILAFGQALHKKQCNLVRVKISRR